MGHCRPHPGPINMDPVTIALTALAAFSAIMGVGQAVETYALWRLQRNIPAMVEQGAIELVSSKAFRKKLIQASAEEIATRLKLSVFGQLGVQKKLEKRFAGALVEGDEGLQAIKGMLPKKAQEMLEKHPQLIEFGMRILPDLLPKILGAVENGETQATEGAY